jgi:hypothetical protein
MSEGDKVLFTSALTILGGVAIFVVGQFVLKYFIEPAQELRRAIGEVRFNLAYHAQVIHTPIARTPERSDKAYEALIRSSCDLLARVSSVPFYGIVSFYTAGVVPAKRRVIEAAIELRGLSTYVHETGDSAAAHADAIASRVAKIEKYLNFEPLSRDSAP